MKVVLGADPLGFELKEKVKKHLVDEGYNVIDVGTLDLNAPVLYIEASDNVAKAIQNKEADRGIVFCGTGMGVGIVANKHKGVYCAVVESQWTAHESRVINDANVLAIGGRILGESVANDIVDTFLKTPWCENSSEQRKKNLGALLQQLYKLEESTLK